jgi:hypothetical protein
MMKKLLVLVAMAAVVAVLVAGVSGYGTTETPRVYASRLAGIQGAGETGINVQNLDQSQQAQINAEFYPQSGGSAKQFSGTAQPGAAYNFYLPTMNLADGAYAAIVNSDRQIAAIARTEWPSKGGAATYSNVIPDINVSLPLVTKDYQNQCSLISIQNTNTSSSANAVVDFYAVGGASSVLNRKYPIGPGTSVTLRLCDEDDFVANLPKNFLGSVKVTSEDGVTKLGVQSFVDITNSDKAVFAFEGVPAEQAASELYAPLFRASQKLGANFGDTGISVVNTQSTPVDVTVTFYPAGGDCAKAPVSQMQTIAASSSYVFWQGPVNDNPLKSTNCYGAAKISAANDGKILAIVNDGVNNYSTGKYNINAAAYNAVSSDQSGTTVALPLFRTGHTAYQLWTGISAMNVGTAAADITLSVSNAPTGQTTANAMSMANVGQFSTAVFWPQPIFNQGAPWNSTKDAYGSATINSSQPVVVIVNDTSQSKDPNKLYDSSTYNGIKVGQ